MINPPARHKLVGEIVCVVDRDGSEITRGKVRAVNATSFGIHVDLVNGPNGGRSFWPIEQVRPAHPGLFNG